MKNPNLEISALIDLLTDNGIATFKGHSNHPGIAGWVTETETLLAKAFDFTWLIWEDRKSIESNIRFRLRLAGTKSPKEAEALRDVGKMEWI